MASPEHGRAKLPTANSTYSYWHSEPSSKLLGHRTTTQLPSEADVVVVGSGITGTFAARELVAGGRRVLVLEAREACWGATGRNGGHCHPGVWNNDAEVARFELATFNLIRDLIAEHDIPCHWHVVGGVQPIFRSEVLAAARKQMARLQHLPDLRDKATLITDKAELAAHCVPGAIAAVYQPNAAQLWPYKLVAWLLEKLLAEHHHTVFNLQTTTPVTKLAREGSSWMLETERGSVRARDVLLATNAYTSHLLPQMTNLIVPMRGQVCAIESAAAQLPHSYVWMTDSDVPSQEYLVHSYLIHRKLPDPQTPGPLIFGLDLAAPTGDEGVSRDDELNPALSHLLRKGLDNTVRLRSQGEEAPALRTAYEWSGIMGYSRDSNPWVGRVPGEFMLDLGISGSELGQADGLWISAGYTGHGMPVAARCGVAVAQMILGKDGVSVPPQWLASQRRADVTRDMEMPRTVKEMTGHLATDEAEETSEWTQMG